MTNFKEKVKNYWEEHKYDIVFWGALTTLTVEAIVIAWKSYRCGFLDGGVIGFHEAMDWFDRTFPDESHARELFERYAKEHPEEIVYRKI